MTSHSPENTRPVNLVADYERAQARAAEYLARKEEIPPELYSAIQTLANQNSGFTGLTVHEAFVGKLRRQGNI